MAVGTYNGYVTPVIDDTKEDLVQLIGFNVGKKIFAADIMSVQEILRDPTINSLEDSPDHVSGIIHLRGQVVPALDLRQRLGNETSHDSERQNWVLITRIDDLTVGFVADSVMRILTMDAASILPAPEITLYGMDSPYIRGICESDLGMLVVLELNRLLAGDEIKAIKTMCF
jgi:purine-binding chemotaxis protein CheW